MTVASIVSLGGSIGPFCTALLHGEDFGPSWLRTAYLIMTGVSWPFFVTGAGMGARLLLYSRGKEPRLLLPWNSMAAFGCFACACGYGNLIAAQGLWTYQLVRMDIGWLVAIMALVLAFLLGLFAFSVIMGVKALCLRIGMDDSTISDSGDDIVSFQHEVVQFENNKEFWSADDDAEIEPESRLQY